MAKAPWCNGYDAAQLLVDRCLRRDGSLFSPSEDQAIWTLELAELLEGRIGPEDLREGSFIGKLEEQLSGLEPEAIQLAAELLYVELLGENDTKGNTKEEHVNAVLRIADGTTPIPEELRLALDGGVATYGSGKIRRDAFMRFLLRLLVHWTTLEPPERARLLDSPWEFGALVEGIRSSQDALQANALLHLTFPEHFSSMISPGHRKQLLEAFAGAPGVAEAGDEDQKVEVIRELSSEALGREVQLYQKPFHAIWSEGASPGWEGLLPWAIRLYERPDFDEAERDYKLRIAEKVAAARSAMVSGADNWLETLKAAFTDSENNLTNWMAADDFLKWCKKDSERAHSVISEMWQAEDGRAGVAAFLAALPREVASGPGGRLTLATFLALGRDPLRTPFFKWTIYKDFSALLGLSVRSEVDLDSDAINRPVELATSLGVKPERVRRFLRDKYPRSHEDKWGEWILNAEQIKAVVERFGEPEEGEEAESAVATYSSWVSLLEELRLRLLARGTVLRDLLDAQGIAYWLAVGPPDDWSEEDKAAFEGFRNPETPTEDPEPVDGEVSLPPATAELASKTYLPQEWLQEEILDLLIEKRQLMLYGPPGTGKTFVAQRLGDHIAEHGGETRLVQLHPSYTYEDFFEGYRPKGGDDSGIQFELVPGPLREIARAAGENPERPYLLIVDELNRGNVAKVFGELYFLLEYRGSKIELQYSRDEQFRLPSNLFFVGTMNTADRSIALVDSALRRRFYFVGLVPTQDPVKKVLPKWLEAHGLDPEPAVLLDALNESINDDDFSIGPSYFMTKGGVAPNVERVWLHAIKPLLAEHYYGSGRDLEAEFSPGALRKRLAEAADVAPIETSSPLDDSTA